MFCWEADVFEHVCPQHQSSRDCWADAGGDRESSAVHSRSSSEDPKMTSDRLQCVNRHVTVRAMPPDGSVTFDLWPRLHTTGMDEYTDCIIFMFSIPAVQIMLIILVFISHWNKCSAGSSCSWCAPSNLFMLCSVSWIMMGDLD